jgi:hypothetical protein
MYLFTKTTDNVLKTWDCLHCPSNGIANFDSDDKAIEHTKQTGHTTTTNYSHFKEYRAVHTGAADDAGALAIPTGTGWPGPFPGDS